MLFFLIRLSISKQVFNYIINPKNLLLNIEPFDIIEIVLEIKYSAYFSKWDDFDNLTIEIYSEKTKEDEPLQTFNSNNGLRCCF